MAIYRRPARESLSGPMRYVVGALLLRGKSSREVRLVFVVPRIGPPRDPRAGEDALGNPFVN